MQMQMPRMARNGVDASTPKAGSAADPAVPTDAGVIAPAADGGKEDAAAPSDPGPPAVRPDRPRDPLPLTQTEIPGETADAEALKTLSKWQLLPVFSSARRLQQNSSDRGTNSVGEERLLPIFADGNRDLNNFICKSRDATLDVPTVSYNYDMDHCPEDYVHGVELARVEGSGRMSRLWFTSSTPNPGLSLSNEMLRIYVDDNPRPLVQARLSDALHGTAGDIFAAPFGSGASNSMTWYYPVVFSNKLVVVFDNLHDMYFYEVDVVLDEQPKERWAPLTGLPERDAAHARLAMPSPRAASDVTQKTEHLSLAPGALQQVTLQGPSTTNELQLRVPSGKLSTLSAVTISVKWDHGAASAIDLPLLGLFAAQLAPPEKNSLALAATLDANDIVLSLRLPMPFRVAAEWTLTNTGAEATELDLTWLGAPGVPSSEFGFLHTQRFETALPADKVEQTVAQISARGRLVGMCFDIASNGETSTLGSFAQPLNFGSGDVTFTIDGKKASFSTSTDAYVDDSFSFVDAPRSTAFAHSWNKLSSPERDPQGQLSFCRWHVLGSEVDFGQELVVTHEIAQRDPSYLRLHRSTAYYYGPP